MTILEELKDAISKSIEKYIDAHSAIHESIPREAHEFIIAIENDMLGVTSAPILRQLLDYRIDQEIARGFMAYAGTHRDGMYFRRILEEVTSQQRFELVRLLMMTNDELMIKNGSLLAENVRYKHMLENPDSNLAEALRVSQNEMRTLQKHLKFSDNKVRDLTYSINTLHHQIKLLERENDVLRTTIADMREDLGSELRKRDRKLALFDVLVTTSGYERLVKNSRLDLESKELLLSEIPDGKVSRVYTSLFTFRRPESGSGSGAGAGSSASPGSRV